MQLLIFLLFSWLFAGQISSDADSAINRQATSEYRIALSTVNNPSFIPTEEQLNIALSSGISLFEVPSSSDISIYTERNITILLHADILYPTASNLLQNQNLIIQEVTESYSRFSERQQSNIAAVGLFRFPADYSTDFNSISKFVADSISGVTNKPLYYYSSSSQPATPSGFSFVVDHISTQEAQKIPLSLSSAVIYLEPSPSSRETLSALSDIMRATQSLNESIIILPADWFFRIQNDHPDLIPILENYTNGRILSMPLPAKRAGETSANPGIIILLIILAGLVVQYKYQPVILQFVGRYFFNHSFFMADIMDNRLRNVSAGLTFMGIHSIVNGLFFYTFFETLFTGKGLNVLSHYFAPFVPENFELPVIFIAATLVGLIVHLISVLWLRLVNRQINSFSKAINLYIWPFFITLIPTSLLVFNLHTLDSEFLAAIMAVLYLLTWLLSFASASVNAARRLEKYRVLSIIFTIGLYSLLFTGLLLVLMLYPALFEPIELALEIP